MLISDTVGPERYLELIDKDKKYLKNTKKWNVAGSIFAGVIGVLDVATTGGYNGGDYLIEEAIYGAIGISSINRNIRSLEDEMHYFENHVLNEEVIYPQDILYVDVLFRDVDMRDPLIFEIKVDDSHIVLEEVQ